MKILVYGLPGAGKTTFATMLKDQLKDCAYFNADEVRKMANDWDFSMEGRMRQADRMLTYADFESERGRLVICDFVCPTNQTRARFNPDIDVFMDTIKQGRFEDTNKLFEKPDFPLFEITKQDDKIYQKTIEKIEKTIRSIKNV